MINTHFIISSLLILLLVIFNFQFTNTIRLNKILKLLLIINFLTFNIYLIYERLFDFNIHLPLHLCYLTEWGIFLSILFKNKYFYPLLALNALGGGITGFTNSNLTNDSLIIEHVHLYLSHFNLLLFSMIVYKDNLIITKTDLIKSIFLNAMIFFSIFYFNHINKSNYWFTHYRPEGQNLTQILPDWPYYLLCLIVIGLTSFLITYKLFQQPIKGR
tara:strand:+ start:3767 stop:4414 length:648 start_codon:yes stop_codon:yes gene_type:complete